MSQQVSFKVLHPFLNIVISIVLFLVSFFVLHSILTRLFNTSQLVLVLIPASSVISYFITRSLTKSEAKISITNHQISITLYNEIFNHDYFINLDLSEIVGFEIQKNNPFHRLILYRDKRSPVVLTLIDSIEEEIQLLTILKPNLKHVGKNTPLSSASYPLAFIKGLGGLKLVLAGIWVVYLGMNWAFYYLDPNFLFNPSFLWLSLPIGFLLIYNQLFYRLNFRLVGRDLSWILILLVCGGMFFTFPTIGYALLQKPVNVKELSEGLKYPHEKFFITEALTIDSDIIGYRSNISGSSKSLNHHVWHYFAIPIIGASGASPINHSVWIAGKYAQKIRKVVSATDKEKARIGFMNSAVQKFKGKSSMKAAFYEVQHSDQQLTFKNQLYFQAAASTQHLSRPALILNAHYESFEAYQNTHINSMLKGVAITLIAVILCSLIIAYYR